jgi:hypothetical protein
MPPAAVLAEKLNVQGPGPSSPVAERRSPAPLSVPAAPSAPAAALHPALSHKLQKQQQDQQQQASSKAAGRAGHNHSQGAAAAPLDPATVAGVRAAAARWKHQQLKALQRGHKQLVGAVEDLYKLGGQLHCDRVYNPSGAPLPSCPPAASELRRLVQHKHLPASLGTAQGVTEWAKAVQVCCHGVDLHMPPCCSTLSAASLAAGCNASGSRA